MSRSPVCAAFALLIGGVLVSMPVMDARQDPPRTTFKSGASAVAVDVAVRDRTRRAITGLTAADFQVRDNGVPQQIDLVSYGKLPIDVTVALDVSYSVTGALLNRLRNGVVQLMRDLGREDRLKLVLFNMRVNRTTDFTRDDTLVERAIRGAAAGGGTALLDAISVTLVSGSSHERRQLVVFFTDGSDSSSITSPEALTAVAQRSRATLTFVMPGLVSPMTVFSGQSGTGAPTRTFVNSAAPRAPLHALFSTLASETGGAILPVTEGANLSTAFRRVLSEFRSAYVLYYTARGVDPAGYHTIQVDVTRKDAQVQARRGYFGS